MDDLVILRPQGLYCPAGDFYIDPWRAVPRAVITHAHSDHARAGHGHVLASEKSAGLLRRRLGAALPLQTLRYGEAISHRGVRLSLHPAGHVLGSAQVRIEHAGRVWVASGDYYLSAYDERNPTCEPFEPVRCDCFITESTFGLPVYRWREQGEVFAQIDDWWRSNAAAGRPSLLLAYSLGKAQRVLAGVDRTLGPLIVHPAVENMNQAYRDAGVGLPPTQAIGPPAGPGPRGDAANFGNALIVAPPGAGLDTWAQQFGAVSTAFASGWMQSRGMRRRRGGGRGFVLSDHADWPGLQRAIESSGAERIIVTHGDEVVLVRWLRERGFDAGGFRDDRRTIDPGDDGDANGLAPADARLV